MSKPQTKTTQLRNGLKTTGAASKKATSNSPSQATIATTKVNSQSRTAPRSTTTEAKRILDEKNKLKGSIQTRKADPATVTTRGQRFAAKPENKPPTKTLAIPRAAPKITNRQIVPSTKGRIAAAPNTNDQPGRLNIAGKIRKKHYGDIKPNVVLDTYHNVTVVSPPPRRRENIADPITESIVPVENVEQPKRVRTHSLEEEEIIVLRTDSAKHRIEQQILTDTATSSDGIDREPVTNEVERQFPVVKESVAFEVAFDKPLRSKSRAKSREASRTRAAESPFEAKLDGGLKDSDPDNYSDDFESYKSDFETGSSTQNGSGEDTESESSLHSVNVEDEENSTSTAYSSSVEGNTKCREGLHVNNSEDEEESELTQYPVTVIQREKELERKLDSGNYEMNSRKHPKSSDITAQIGEKPFDSMDTSCSVASTDQLDSGISGYAISSNAQAEVDKFGGIVFTFGGYAGFNDRPIVQKRGTELMTKIQFDTLTFSLFELKPISYDIYMQTYGTLNTTQCSTQTSANRLSSECQTDTYDTRTMWTQHPPQYDLQTVQKLGASLNGSMTIQNCCGEPPTDEYNPSNVVDVYDGSLQQLATFRQCKGKRAISEHLKSLHKPVDFERLNSFLLRISSLMSRVLSSATPITRQQEQIATLGQNQNHLRGISEGYIHLDTKLLNALQVVRVFASARHDLIITVHASTSNADVYRSDFCNLLMVWSTRECLQPLRLLTTWSEVCRAEICFDCSDIVVCGLHDGSIAMWDLRETYSFCSKLDGYLTHFAATQSVVPTWSSNTKQPQQLMDLGAVVDIRSFRTPPKATALGTYRSLQFAALNDTGILSIWTLVETTAKRCEVETPEASKTHRQRKFNSPTPNSRFEYSSPWARVKLIQSSICDLRNYLERGLRRTQTQFEKTKLLFQKQIYSDDVLRELNSTQMALNQSQQMAGLRFTAIDTGSERIYVCTNRNFVLTCSKSLKSERFRKININESGFLFPTTLKVLTNENYLAVGLSNGSVMILNCNQQKLSLQRNRDGKRLVTPNPNEDRSDIDPETGKSCAIQNIILNERRLLGKEGNDYAAEYDTRPTTAACIALIANEKRPFELRVYDQQLILGGSALRQDLVQSLELSSDGWRLFALVNGQMRTYDFYLDREIAGESVDGNGQRIMDIAVAKSSHNENHLIALYEENAVEVHSLKQ